MAFKPVLLRNLQNTSTNNISKEACKKLFSTLKKLDASTQHHSFSSGKNRQNETFLSYKKSKIPQNLSVSQNCSSSSFSGAALIDLPETHQMLKDTCRQFAEAELWPIAGAIDKACSYPGEDFKIFSEPQCYLIYYP